MLWGALLGGALLGQQPLGATYRTQASTASRGGLVTAGGTLVARFDTEDCIGWGRTTATPNRRVVRGVMIQFEDKQGATAETWALRVYTEDPQAAGFPLATAPLLALGPFSSGIRPAGLVQWTETLIFPAPLEVPADRDVFVGVQLAAAPAWPADGLAVQCVLGSPSLWPVYDQPGTAPIQHGSYGMAIDASGQRYYNSTRQLLIDLLTDAPGGSCLAVTNQASYPIGGVYPGSGGYLSAAHPDATAPARQPGRNDTPGCVLLDAQLTAGSLVVFLLDIGSFGLEQPLTNVVPGSVGVSCLKPASTLVAALSLASTNAALLQVPLTASQRAWLRGLPLLYQVMAMPPTLVLRAGPCLRQVL